MPRLHDTETTETIADTLDRDFDRLPPYEKQAALERARERELDDVRAELLARMDDHRPLWS